MLVQKGRKDTQLGNLPYSMGQKVLELCVEVFERIRAHGAEKGILCKRNDIIKTIEVRNSETYTWARE